MDSDSPLPHHHHRLTIVYEGEDPFYKESVKCAVWEGEVGGLAAGQI